MPLEAARQLHTLEKGIQQTGRTVWYATRVPVGNARNRAILSVASRKRLMAFLDIVKRDRARKGASVDHVFVARRAGGVWHVGIRFKTNA